MTKVIITVRIKATNYCVLTIKRVMLRAAERLRHLLFPTTLASIGPIWVDDLLEMYDFHPFPFLTLLSYNFSLSDATLYSGKRPTQHGP